MNALAVYYTLHKGNNMHSTVNLCPGNGLVITRHLGISGWAKGQSGENEADVFLYSFSLKKTLNVSVASNQSLFWV
jgi:hypothetical protein